MSSRGGEGHKVIHVYFCRRGMVAFVDICTKDVLQVVCEGMRRSAVNPYCGVVPHRHPSDGRIFHYLHLYQGADPWPFDDRVG